MYFDTLDHLTDDGVIVCVTMGFSLIDGGLDQAQAFLPILIAALALDRKSVV